MIFGCILGECRWSGWPSAGRRRRRLWREPGSSWRGLSLWPGSSMGVCLWRIFSSSGRTYPQKPLLWWRRTNLSVRFCAVLFLGGLERLFMGRGRGYLKRERRCRYNLQDLLSVANGIVFLAGKCIRNNWHSWKVSERLKQRCTQSIQTTLPLSVLRRGLVTIYLDHIRDSVSTPPTRFHLCFIADAIQFPYSV